MKPTKPLPAAGDRIQWRNESGVAWTARVRGIVDRQIVAKSGREYKLITPGMWRHKNYLVVPKRGRK
jgi:hypothetical protein